MNLQPLLIAGGRVSSVPEADAVEIAGMTADSRVVSTGYLFAALPGSTVDGTKFIPEAVKKGAAAVLTTTDATVPEDISIPVIRADEPRRALALMAARFYERQPEVAVAVTGTSGKTSVADFTRQIFTALGYAAASLGTMGVIRPSGAIYGSLTTPDPVTLHKTLSELTGDGVTHMAFEASSHGLDQYRLDGVALSAAAFTNFGRDHLDYHASIEEYFNAKLRLFRDLLPKGKPAVVNVDDPRAGEVVAVAEEAGCPVISVGVAGKSLKLLAQETLGFSQRLVIEQPPNIYTIRFPLLGAYQVENALVAAGLAIAAGEPADRVLPALELLKGVPGRLEVVGERAGALAVVDYAHKPEALSAALDAVRPFVTGRLICVFGCGGDRDKGKRPIMGAIAAERADITIVTDDNPRTEDAAQIRSEILVSVPNATEVGDRAEAIAKAVGMMRKGDVVLVAGKGHETGQIVGNKVIPFSDQEQIRAALEPASKTIET